MQFLGKECAPQITINNFLKALERIDIEVEITNELNPIENVWSLHIGIKNDKVCTANGKGVSREAALASGLGELIERISHNHFFAEYYLPKNKRKYFFHPNEIVVSSLDETLNEELRKFYYDEDDQDSIVYDFSFDSEDIICLPFYSGNDNEIVNVPVNLLTNLYGSNGMAAGNSIAEAKVQALSEVIERFVKFEIIREEICIPDIPENILSKYPQVLLMKNSLEANGFRVFIKDASLGGRFPVINITLYNPADGGVFSNFGAHPKFQVALERTMTELCQGRRINEFINLPKPTWNSDLVTDLTNLESHFIDGTGALSWNFFAKSSHYKFWPWDTVGDIENELKWLEEIIKRSGFNCYYFETAHLGIETVRVIVPGMSEIYPVDDLLYDNCNRGKFLRNLVIRIHDLDDSQLELLLESFDEFQITPQQNIFSLIGILPDSETGWDTFRAYELKLAILIHLKNFDEFNAYIDFLSMTDEFDDFYSAVRLFNENHVIANELFDDNLIQRIEKYLVNPFFSLKELNEGVFTMNAHRELIDLFEKINFTSVTTD